MIKSGSHVEVIKSGSVLVVGARGRVRDIAFDRGYKAECAAIDCDHGGVAIVPLESLKAI